MIKPIYLKFDKQLLGNFIEENYETISKENNINFDINIKKSIIVIKDEFEFIYQDNGLVILYFGAMIGDISSNIFVDIGLAMLNWESFLVVTCDENNQ